MIIKTYSENSNKTDEWLLTQEFLSLNPQDVLAYHEQHQAHTTIVLNENEDFAFIVSQNPLFIRKLGMIEENPKIKPIKTMDLFEENPFDGVTLSKFLKDMEDNQVNLHFDFEGRAYSFQLLKDEKIAAAFQKIETLNKKKIKP